jgi:hypothetical protein
MSTSTCLNCGVSDQERPLLNLKFQGNELNICPQCMPILIHKPQQLVEKIPYFQPSGPPAPHDH